MHSRCGRDFEGMDSSVDRTVYQLTLPQVDSPCSDQAQISCSSHEKGKNDVAVPASGSTLGQSGGDGDESVIVASASMRRPVSVRLRSKSNRKKNPVESRRRKEKAITEKDAIADQTLSAAGAIIKPLQEASSGGKGKTERKPSIEIAGYCESQIYQRSAGQAASSKVKVLPSSRLNLPSSSKPSANIPRLETLSEAEIEKMTLTNTKKNSQRNLKARFARVFQTLESLAMVPDSVALPLVRPDDVATTQSRSESLWQRPSDEIPEEELSLAEFQHSNTLDTDPCSVADSVLSAPPSVRISTGVTIVSVADLSRLGRKAVRAEERDHPDRESARALIPRSQMSAPGDFRQKRSPKPPVLAKSLQPDG